MSRTLYRLIAALARLAERTGRSRDLEIIVLRHQLAVLRRQLIHPQPERCTIHGCHQTPQARGLCATHYNQWHRHQTPQARGLCATHYNQWHRQQTAQSPDDRSQ